MTRGAGSELFGTLLVVNPQQGPLYLQLKRWIEDAVRRGLVQPGDALPSERDLAARVDMSRVTVRKAVQNLVQEGLLIQRHGSGGVGHRPRTGLQSVVDDQRRGR